MTAKKDEPDISALARSLAEGRSSAEAVQLIAALQQEVSKKVAPAADASDGVLVKHIGGGTVSLLDTSGATHDLDDGGHVLLTPLPAAPIGQARGPFSLIFVVITSREKSEARIDLTALLRNAARWGDPTFYLPIYARPVPHS